MFTSKEKKLLLLLASIQFTHIVDFMIMMPLGPQLMKLFGLSAQQFGLLVSSYTLSAGISGFIASFYIDRFPRRRALLIFYIGFALGTFACALSPTYSTLLLARSLTGFFGGVLGSLVLAVVGDAIAVEKRGQAMGIVMAAFSVASIFGVPASLYLARHFHWHSPFFALTSFSLLIGLFIWMWMPRMAEHLEGRAKKAAFFDSLQAVWTSPSQMSGLLMTSFLILGQFTVIPFLAASLVSNARMDEGDLPLIYLIGGCFTIFSSPFIGKMADKYGNHKVFPIFLFASMVPIFIVTHMTPAPIYLILSTTVVFFVCTGGRMIPAMSMLNSTVSPQRRGSFMSLVSCIQQVSSAFAAYLAGVIVFTEPSTGRLLHYDYVGYVAIFFSVMAYFVSLQVKRHQTSMTAAASLSENAASSH